MQLAIATNPQTEQPQELWSILDKQERANEPNEHIDADFDQGAFDLFKKNIAQNGQQIAVKS